MYASTALPSFATLATRDKHPQRITRRQWFEGQMDLSLG